MTLHLPHATQKRIDLLDFRAEQLELQHTARKDIIVNGPTTEASCRKGEQAGKEARRLRRHIQQLIIKHHPN